MKDRIQARPVELKEVLDIGIQIADGLDAAHAAGIVHRDIKSANIMVTAAGQVKIMDFGLAKLAGRSKVTNTGAPLGTVDYMSPEQASGKTVDHRTDIWSLGVVMYEMVSGQLPFRADYDHAIMYSIVNVDELPLTGLIADLPQELEDVISKAMSKDVAQRYQSAAEVAAELRTFKQQLSSRAAHVASHTSPQLSIAVLPFANMSADPEQEYFCDGMTEDIINDLTKLEKLRVVSRTSSFAFKGKNEDIREIGRKLRVRTVLEGSVRKAANRLRVTAQLINVADGYHIWSQRYDRDLEDVFAIQDELSESIVNALEMKLTPKSRRALEKAPTTNVQAYDLYLRGRELLYNWQRKSIEKARDLFGQAIAQDPSYSLAYAGIADCYCVLYTDYSRDNEQVEQAMQSSQKALELDPDLAEAHAAHAYSIVCLRNEYDMAEQEFETALRLNPKLFGTFYFYARSCRIQGKMEKAAQLFEQACLVRPEDYQSRVFLAETYKALKFETGAEAAYQRAVENVERHLDLHPEDARAHYLGATALVALGESEKGLEWARKAVTMDPHNPILLYNISCFFSVVGELEDSIGYLRMAFDVLGKDNISREWALTDPDLDAIREDPRFDQILARDDD